MDADAAADLYPTRTDEELATSSFTYSSSGGRTNLNAGCGRNLAATSSSNIMLSNVDRLSSSALLTSVNPCTTSFLFLNITRSTCSFTISFVIPTVGDNRRNFSPRDVCGSFHQLSLSIAGTCRRTYDLMARSNVMTVSISACSSLPCWSNS